MESMNSSLPKGATEVKNPKYPTDSFVIPNVGHMSGQKGELAKVLKAVEGVFYVVDFGDGPHKWYAEGELDKVQVKK